MSGAFNNYGQDWKCPICDESFESTDEARYQNHLDKHNEDAEKAVEDLRKES